MEIRPEVQQAREIGPARFEGRTNYSDDRKMIVEKSGEIELRRFLLSSDSKVQEKLNRLRESVAIIHETYPELIGVSIFGSQVKGYAKRTSDLDAYLIIDSDTTKSQISKDDMANNEDVYLEQRWNRLHEKILDTLKSQELGGLGLGSGIKMCGISSMQINKFCETGILDEQSEELWVVMRLFHMGIGEGIYASRERVIATLEEMGPHGEKAWSHLMEALFQWENRGFSDDLKEKRRRLYPKTLAEGRKYFLRNVTKKQ